MQNHDLNSMKLELSLVIAIMSDLNFVYNLSYLAVNLPEKNTIDLAG